MLPYLEPHCGSWIIVDRANGRPVLETSNRNLAERLENTPGHTVLTVARYLALFNREVSAAGGCQPSPEAMARAIKESAAP